MKITIDKIKTSIQDKDFTCESDTYTNLQDELVFKCKYGHTFKNTWKAFRDKMYCPVCAQSFYTPDDIQKPQNVYTLALDQATYNTGWALFENQELTKYGVFKTNKSDSEATRLYQIKEFVMDLIKTYDIHYVVIEGIQYEEHIGITTYQILARLQGVLLNAFYEYNMQHKLHYIICPPPTWRSFNKIKGKERSVIKKAVQDIVYNKYKIKVTDDCADAIGIGLYTIDKLKPSNIINNWE